MSQRDPSKNESKLLLKECGYTSDRLEQCVVQLIAELKDNREFFHKIGSIVQSGLAVGKFTEIKKKHKNFLKSIINVQLFI